MDDAAMYMYLMGKSDQSKDDFLDWFEFIMDFNDEDADLYEVVISWTEEQTVEFAKQWDFDMDRADIAIYNWDDDYIEKEKDSALTEPSSKENSQI